MKKKTASGLTERATVAGWNRYWRLRMLYHRYEVSGFENLDQDRSCLIAGYHGRPTAFDLCMLSVKVHERWGYLPHGIVHESFDRVPILGPMFRNLGFVVGDGDGIREAVRRKEHIITAPGGTREAYRSYKTRYRIDWGDHYGYVRLALKYRMPVIPVAASGVDDVFIGINDGYRLGKKLKMPLKAPCWFAFGATGLWPLTLPLPAKIRQVIGKPLDPKRFGIKGPNDLEKIAKFHKRVVGEIQTMMARARRLS